VEKKLQKKLASAHIPARTNAQRKVMLFSHLHQYERELSISRNLPIVGGTIHPAVLQLGLQYAEGTISGSNARCVALLNAMKKMIGDYVTPPQKELSRDLDAKIKPHIIFLRQCRTLSVSMGNAIRFLKSKINSLQPGVSDEEAKEELCRAIDDFVDCIALAGTQIAITAGEKIRDGDVILTYGW
jgi:translation initiation factor eIF-2B subunit delta